MVDRSDKVRAIHVREDVGVTAHILQRRDLQFDRVPIDHPTFILVRRGVKTILAGSAQYELHAGDAIALNGGQTIDIRNRPVPPRDAYEAQWIIPDPAIIAGLGYMMPDTVPIGQAAALSRLERPFVDAFDRACQAVTESGLPNAVAGYRVGELLVWLAMRGHHFVAPKELSLSQRIRRLIETAPSVRWSIATAADHFALSEMTLRRRLADDGETFGNVLADVRMAMAMRLLQSTDLPVNRIALDVGYDSASRFAIRFRERFGFPPTAIRGHARALSPSLPFRGSSAGVGLRGW